MSKIYMGICLALFLNFLVGCEGEAPFAQTSSVSYQGYIVVSSVRTGPSSGPGTVALFKPNGAFVKVLGDYYQTNEYVSGLSQFDGETILVAVNGTDRMESINIVTGAVTSFAAHTQINANPLRQIATDADGSTYIVEANQRTIEKVDSNGNRAGNPFISTTVGSCVLNDPFGIAYISSLDAIGVISRGGGRYSAYDTNGNCLYHVTTAPFNAGQPTGITYHEKRNKILVTFATSDNIYALSPDGTNATLIYNDDTVIGTPRAIATDSDGYVYIGNDDLDTVEKFSFNGSTLTRVGGTSLIGTSIYTQNPTHLLVLE